MTSADQAPQRGSAANAGIDLALADIDHGEFSGERRCDFICIRRRDVSSCVH